MCFLPVMQYMWFGAILYYTWSHLFTALYINVAEAMQCMISAPSNAWTLIL